MGYVPKDAKWYIAELIVEIRVEDSEVNIVHKNLVLVRADSPEEVFENATKVGKGYDNSYSNPSGQLVNTKYRGMRYLDVIHNDLENGAELLFEQQTAISKEDVENMLRTREQLPLFKDKTVDLSVPDYAPGEIVREALNMIHSEQA